MTKNADAAAVKAESQRYKSSSRVPAHASRTYVNGYLVSCDIIPLVSVANYILNLQAKVDVVEDWLEQVDVMLSSVYGFLESELPRITTTDHELVVVLAYLLKVRQHYIGLLNEFSVDVCKSDFSAHVGKLWEKQFKFIHSDPKAKTSVCGLFAESRNMSDQAMMAMNDVLLTLREKLNPGF